MRYFSKAMLVASAALCLNLSAYSQDIWPKGDCPWRTDAAA